MKRLLLEQKLRALGCSFQRRGGNHDIWNYGNGRKFPFARHSDIDERLADSMINKAKQNRGN
ncbi:MAG: type II toxin-antitoxin system HicA family toxin [Tannerella sp.]|nr:type II toxin-antitoxin system HicA family toxin [Tannerella sp.]